MYRTPATRGAWTDFVVHAKWSYTGTSGLLEVWKNGAQVVNQTGPNIYNDQTNGYMKIGFYKWSWPSSIPVRIAYFDAVRIAGAGGNYATVAPR
jgi:hypothetical protein